MKPRNEYERRVVALSAKQPEITYKQKMWAKSHCFDHIGYKCKGEVWCSHCGAIIPNNTSLLAEAILGEHVECPICGTRLQIKKSRKKRIEEKVYFTILARVKEFQVCRHFIAKKFAYKVDKHLHGCDEIYYSVQEAVQVWMDENGRQTIVARPCRPMFMVNDAWDFGKPMEIRTRGSAYSDRYRIAGVKYPWGGVLPILRRNGYKGNSGRLAESELFRMLLTDHEAEVLMKMGQLELLHYKWLRGWGPSAMRQEHAVRIAHRAGYFVKDASMWYDYLRLLDYFHLDTHNAHYVCPKDLKAEHDKLLKRKMRIEVKKREEKKRREDAEWEAKYKEMKAAYFGIAFNNGKLFVSVVQSVAEMAEEGKEMKHCVYSNDYYKKDDSLILSAKDAYGKRIETIEVSLKTFEIVQSRGVCNSNTEHHDEIVALVNRNMNLIRQAS